MNIQKVRTLVYVSVLLLYSFSSFSQVPAADFSADKTEGCGLLAVRFTNLSTNNPTSYLWEVVNDGRTYTVQSPTITFTQAGEYTIRLTATNAHGSDTQEKVSFVKVFPVPQVSFTASPRTGCAPLSVSFSDNTVSASPIITRNWDFGDGNTSNVANPIHEFTSAQDYSVILTVTNEHGCSQSAIQQDYVQVETQPEANFTYNVSESCEAPLEVSFLSSSSGNIASYEWDFGDGNTSTQQNPTHVYETEGVFSVSLTVHTNSGCSHTHVKDDLIVINAFEADFVVSKASVCIGEQIQFTDASNSNLQEQLWDFGNGVVSIDANPVMQYDSPGTYTITYAAVSVAGCLSEIEYTSFITVYEELNVDFFADNETACEIPFSVNFTASLPSYESLEWNFGDGATSVEEQPSHTYSDYGNYTVQLLVTDENSCVTSIEKTDFITVNEPVANFSSDITAGCFPLEVQFVDESHSANNIVAWYWDFGDGNFSVEQSPTHTFDTDTGTFNVSLTVTDDLACSHTFLQEEYIGVGEIPTPDFTALQTESCVKNIIEFVDNSGEFVNQWFWDFGDENTSTDQNPEHMYEESGLFTVSLTVGQYDCFADLIIDDYITILAPVALYTVDPPVLCELPATVSFEEQAVDADTYTWIFDDGNELFVEENGSGGYRWEYNGLETVADTNTVNPTHIYTVSGVYNTMLIVKNFTTDCTDTLSISISVSDIYPGFTETSIETCQYNGITFSDTTTTLFNINYWEWDFGDGSPLQSGDVSTPTHVYENSGLFDVKLVVRDVYGCSDSITKASFITVHELPVPSFNADVLTGCAPLEVQFSESSLATAPDSIVNWMWNFGDGTQLEIENTANNMYTWVYNSATISVDTLEYLPVHTFIERGDYTVSLTVTDSRTCESTLEIEDFIQPTFPHPSFVAPNVICFDTPVEFENTSTGTDLSFQWNFGDGSPVSEDEIPDAYNYTVSENETFTVRLLAVDANMCDSTFTKEILIARPIPDIVANETVWDCPPFIVQFSAEDSENASSWSWNFGDIQAGSSNTSSLENPQHTYVVPGVYTVQLTVTDEHNCSDVLILPDYITLGGPTGSFTFSPSIACVYDDVDFTAVSDDAIEHIWVFDDGETFIGDKTTSYSYDRGRRYSPILVLRDENECERAILADEQLIVYDVNFDFESIPNNACEESIIDFINESTSFFDVDSWNWTFSDGTEISTEHAQHFHTYGMHDVILSATIGHCAFTDTVFDAVGVYQTPNPSFTIPESSNRFDIVPIVNTSDTLLVPVTTVWDFGNGAIDTSYTPEHFYSHEGLYEIQLLQYTIPECEAVAYQTITIDRSITLPNVFSPNGDGFNDIFMENMELDFIIINRWGQKLYEGNKGWDGTYNGNQVAAGTYFYIVNLPDGEIEKGPVTLLRD